VAAKLRNSGENEGARLERMPRTISQDHAHLRRLSASERQAELIEAAFSPGGRVISAARWRRTDVTQRALNRRYGKAGLLSS
jgi:hypothetical protein